MIAELKAIFRRELDRFDGKSKAGQMTPTDYSNLDKLCSALKKLTETDTGSSDDVFANFADADLKKLLAEVVDD